MVSVEAFEPYLNKLKEKTVCAANHEIYPMRIEQIFNRLAVRHFDLVLLIDVIEHLPRRRALDLIVRLNQFAQRGIVIFSPIGRVEQEDLDDNDLQRHRSFWKASDWSRLGYDVEVCEGFHGFLDPPASAAWAIKVLASHL